MAKYKRYYTGQQDGPGKGHWQRDAQVSQEIAAKNHCATFGHFIRHGFCTCCHIPADKLK